MSISDIFGLWFPIIGEDFVYLGPREPLVRPEYSCGPWKILMMKPADRGEFNNPVRYCGPRGSSIRRVHVQ